MSLIQYDTFPSLQNVQDEINRFFGNHLSHDAHPKLASANHEQSSRSTVVEATESYNVPASLLLALEFLAFLRFVPSTRMKTRAAEKKDNLSRYECSYDFLARPIELSVDANTEKINAPYNPDVLGWE